MAASEGIGVFGGTFDPIHVAHLRAAEEAREALALGEVRFVPSADPPHKDRSAVSGAAHRLRMVELAIRDVPGFRAWDVELHRPGPSYSVDTLHALRNEVGSDVRIVFLIGRDAFDEVHTWRAFPAVLGLCDFVVLTRPPDTRPLAADTFPVATRHALCYDPAIAGFRHESGHRVTALTVTGLDVSATDIRRRVATGRSIRFLVPGAVDDYIRQQGLYRSTDASS